MFNKCPDAPLEPEWVDWLLCYDCGEKISEEEQYIYKGKCCHCYLKGEEE